VNQGGEHHPGTTCFSHVEPCKIFPDAVSFNQRIEEVTTTNWSKNLMEFRTRDQRNRVTFIMTKSNGTDGAQMILILKTVEESNDLFARREG